VVPVEDFHGKPSCMYPNLLPDKPMRDAVIALLEFDAELLQVTHFSMVEILKQLADHLVRFTQSKEVAFAQTSQDLPFHDLHARFYLGIVSGAAYTRRRHHSAIALSHIQISWIEVRLKARRLL